MFRGEKFWLSGLWTAGHALDEDYVQARSGAPAHPDAYANEPMRRGLRVTWNFSQEYQE